MEKCGAERTQYSNIPTPQDYNQPVMFAMTKTSYDSPLAAELKQISGLKVKIAEPLARYTSMKVGGPADYFIEAQTDAALASVLRLLNQRAMSFCLLGNGSNVLISDRGVRGAVIRLAGEFKKIEWQEEAARVHVNVGAAYAVTQLVREAARKGYAGLEFAEGIPGSVGGALFMNAGAYGSEFEKVADQIDGFQLPRFSFTGRNDRDSCAHAIAQGRARRGRLQASRVGASAKSQPAFRLSQLRVDVS
jgi:FAD binding domain